MQRSTTTSIASLNIQGRTIHSWFGIGDGIYTTPTLLDKLSNNELHSPNKQNILTTEILLIDEISVLS